MTFFVLFRVVGPATLNYTIGHVVIGLSLSIGGRIVAGIVEWIIAAFWRICGGIRTFLRCCRLSILGRCIRQSIERQSLNDTEA